MRFLKRRRTLLERANSPGPLRVATVAAHQAVGQTAVVTGRTSGTCAGLSFRQMTAGVRYCRGGWHVILPASSTRQAVPVGHLVGAPAQRNSQTRESPPGSW